MPVAHHNGLKMAIVMMTTIMPNVVGMVETVVVTMSIHNIALIVLALIQIQLYVRISCQKQNV